MLDRAKFPNLTDDEFAEFTAELDRERLKASDSAYKNASKKEAEERQKAIEAAIAEERARLEMDEQQKLEAERKKVEEAQKALAAERKSLVATKRLAAAGLPEDKIDGLLPLIVNTEDTALETTLDTFIGVFQDSVKAQVDSTKQELLNNAQPPQNPTTAPVDNQTAALEMLKTGNEAAAIDLMFQSAGVKAE